MAAREPRWRFLLLTLSLCAWMLLAPHVGERWILQLLLQLVLIHFVVVTLWANPRWSTMRGVLIASWAVSLACAASIVAPLSDDADRIARAVQAATMIPLLALLAAGSLRFVFARRQLDGDGIFATVGAYLLIAFVFAQLYTLLQFWDPSSFSAPVPLAERTPQQVHADLLYYSLITLATVGYGDILPVSDTARTFAVIEATVGQFYVAVIVAVFVGMYSAQAQRRTEPDTDARGKPE